MINAEGKKKEACTCTCRHNGSKLPTSIGNNVHTQAWQRADNEEENEPIPAAQNGL